MIIKNTFYNLTGIIIPIIVSVIAVPIYIELIGQARYGVLILIWATIGFVSFLDFGLGKAVSRQVSIEPHNHSGITKTIWSGLILSLLAGVVIGIALIGLVQMLNIHPNLGSARLSQEAEPAILPAVLLLPITLCCSILTGALQGGAHFKRINQIQIVSGVLSQTIPLIVAWYGFIELSYLVYSTLLVRMSTLLFYFNSCRPLYIERLRPAFSMNEIKRHIPYGGWVSLIAILSPLLVSLDRFMIAHISGPASVTYYTIPYDLVGRTMLLSNAISTTLFPYLASSIKEEANKAAVATSRILTFLLVPATFIVFAALDPFLRLWIGPEAARSSYGIGQIIIIGVWLNALAVPHNVHLLARGSARLAACILLVQIPFYFLALSYCAKEFGLLGVAFAWTARVLFDSLLQVSACGALRNTLRSVTIPAAFVATGYAIYQILTDDLTISIILALLMAGFVSISWQGFLETINQMKGRQPVIPC